MWYQSRPFEPLAVPALDGGRLVFIGIEAISKAGAKKFEMVIHAIGMVLLMTSWRASREKLPKNFNKFSQRSHRQTMTCLQSHIRNPAQRSRTLESGLIFLACLAGLCLRCNH